MKAGVLLNSALLVALLAIVTGGWLLRADPAQPNVEVLPDMAHSARYNAYAANPNFADGKTLQSPPPGAIARGYMPLHYAATPEDAVRAGEALQNPFTADNTNVTKRGAVVFANYCVACHGGTGAGMGPVAQRGYPPPPSLLAPRAVQMKDGQMFHILTYGQNNMPSYAAQVSRDDRWSAILYIRSLQVQDAARAAAKEKALLQSLKPVAAHAAAQSSAKGAQPATPVGGAR